MSVEGGVLDGDCRRGFDGQREGMKHVCGPVGLCGISYSLDVGTEHLKPSRLWRPMPPASPEDMQILKLELHLFMKSLKIAKNTKFYIYLYCL